MREFSSLFRIWHWVFAFCIFGISVTVLLRETYLNGYAIADLLKAKLTTLGVNLELEQARELAFMITGGLWDWHIILGYAFLIFLLARVAKILKNGFDYPKNTNSHKKLVYLGYKFLYLFLIVLACSGVILHLGELFNVSENSLEIFEELHGISGYVVMIFIPLHIIGVVITDIKEDKGLVSRIISGTQK